MGVAIGRCTPAKMVMRSHQFIYLGVVLEHQFQRLMCSFFHIEEGIF
jgi:hypothetical protein